MIGNGTLDQETIKAINKKNIVNLLQKHDGLTMSQIRKMLGVSLPTVSHNIKELMKEGIAEKAGVASSTGGRKPIIIRFLKNARYSFGVDFLIDRIRIVLANLNSEIIRDISFSASNIVDMKSAVCEISERIEKIIDEENLERNKILGVGFSLPGTVNEERMLLEAAPNLKVRNVNFSEFEYTLGFPLYIENEANLAAYAELRLGIAKEMKNLVYISITKGVGTGIVIQGHLYKGNNKRAGEFGHMTVHMKGRKCICGNLGCWNAYVSENALISSYNEVSKVKIFTIKEFFDLLYAGDESAKARWDSYLDYLAGGIRSIIFAMDPHYIVIGGEIASYKDVLLKPLKERIFTDNGYFKQQDIDVLLSSLKGDSSILGASLVPLEKIFFVDQKII